MSSATVNRAVLQQLQAFFDRDHAGIVCVYVYGSLARGEAHEASDVDIAVLYAQDPPLTLDGLGLELGDALERLLGRPVDLLVLNRAPLDLMHHVLRDGVLVYESDASARIRFEVQAHSAYFDLLPYLRQYRPHHTGYVIVTDADLLAKKLACIETCVRELRQLSRPERIAHDIREERFVAHTLQA